MGTFLRGFVREAFQPLPGGGQKSDGRSVSCMKAFLEQEQSGLLYQQGGEWVRGTEQALAFANALEAEKFRVARHIEAAHAVTRLEPSLASRYQLRAPGAYQVGE
jgi:hypothetical protein